MAWTTLYERSGKEVYLIGSDSFPGARQILAEHLGLRGSSLNHPGQNDNDDEDIQGEGSGWEYLTSYYRNKKNHPMSGLPEKFDLVEIMLSTDVKIIWAKMTPKKLVFINGKPKDVSNL